MTGAKKQRMDILVYDADLHSQVKVARMACPDNEFSEHCTGDMPSMDSAYHYWMQPQYDTQRKIYSERRKIIGRGFLLNELSENTHNGNGDGLGVS